MEVHDDLHLLVLYFWLKFSSGSVRVPKLPLAARSVA